MSENALYAIWAGVALLIVLAVVSCQVIETRGKQDLVRTMTPEQLCVYESRSEAARTLCLQRAR